MRKALDRQKTKLKPVPMAHAKKFLFSDEEQLFSAYCKAMGHPARWRILNLLRSGEVKTAHDLTRNIPLAASTLQQHLIHLQRVQLIQLDHDSVCSAGFKIVSPVYEDLMRTLYEFGSGGIGE
ncbi:hypothetical protein CEQ90_00265 [Lewinellaceae bacterium SD302]|nr:hypothetical protein CEQ90_00265 [Lewinellaceae bacterium SD302]